MTVCAPRYIQLRIDNRGRKSSRDVGEAIEVAPLCPAAPGITNLWPLSVEVWGPGYIISPLP